MVRYEVNGQRFLFSTKDRAQFELARQRINAANAAVAARAKANAELAANPLVRAFGSQSQNEAKAAEANLARVLATAPRHEQTPVVTGRSSSRRTPQSPLPTANSREPVRQASRAISTAAVDQELVRPPGSEPNSSSPRPARRSRRLSSISRRRYGQFSGPMAPSRRSHSSPLWPRN